jgi:single-strand DNA-binding protein
VSFSLGSQDRKKNTVWLNCSVWGNSATVAKTFLKKGVQITVHGRLSQNNYTKDGQQRIGLNVDVQDFTLPAKVDSTESKQVDIKSRNSLDGGMSF